LTEGGEVVVTEVLERPSDDRIVWSRLCLEDVERGQGIDQAARHMARGPEEDR
jgi:hypothetical protein